MKTLRPIVIASKDSKETLITLAKRAINAAEMNCCIVRIVLNGIDALVYPQDNLSTIIHHVKLQSILLKLKELEAKA